MNDPRQHHYIPQGYLGGFTDSGTKKGKLTVYDFERRKTFSTIPRNVGGRRDFNRIDVVGIEPNAIETSLAAFEGRVTQALRRIDRSKTFDGDDKIYVLNLLALLNVRSPQRREHIRQFIERVATLTMDVALSSKEIWQQQVQQAVEAGFLKESNVSYEQQKAFHESGNYEVSVAREFQITQEFQSHEVVLRTLLDREWILYVAEEPDSPFVTSDNPATLRWRDPDNVPPMYRLSPGHAMKDTEFFCPLTKRIAVAGTFEGPSGVLPADRRFVGLFNALTLDLTHAQLFASSERFPIAVDDTATISGSELWRQYLTAAPPEKEPRNPLADSD